MRQTVTIETEDTAVLQLLRNLAAMSLVRFVREPAGEGSHLMACLNEVYAEEDSSLDPGFVLAQAEAVAGEEW
ncbi:MAG: hypothetical protein FWD88_06205 [Treponema sp.]|nr:hypothetical protein [Treponema sp.]